MLTFAQASRGCARSGGAANAETRGDIIAIKKYVHRTGINTGAGVRVLCQRAWGRAVHRTTRRPNSKLRLDGINQEPGACMPHVAHSIGNLRPNRGATVSDPFERRPCAL